MQNRRSFLKTFGTTAFIMPLAQNLFAKKLVNELNPEHTWEPLLKYAIQSPSPHNTQPWKMKITSKQEAVLCYDPSRLIPKEDPDGRFMVIALTIFTEYLTIAANDLGWSVEVKMLTDKLDSNAKGYPEFARITLTRNQSVLPRFNPKLILARKTNREDYLPKSISDSTWEKLSKIEGKNDSHKLHFKNDQAFIESVYQLNAESLFDDLDEETKRVEIESWIRFSQKEAAQTKDGLWAKAMNLPSRLLHSFLNHHSWFDGRWGRKRMQKFYQSKTGYSPALAWIEGPFETFDDWVQCGKVLADLWLKLTEENLYLHPFGSIVTSPDKLSRFVTLTESNDGQKPWLIFRIGYSKEPTDSYRLNMNDIILKS